MKQHPLFEDIAERIFERLEYILLEPQRILNVCAKGQDNTSEQLRARYPKAEIVGLDFFSSNVDDMLASMQPRSFDMVFSNCVLNDQIHRHNYFHEFFQLLRPKGLLMFAMLGPDTFMELRALAPDAQLPAYVDMHDIGDALLQVGYSDPVMDMEQLTLLYQNPKNLQNDLKLFSIALNDVRLDGDELPMTIEIIYGHAWMPEKLNVATLDSSGEVSVSVDDIVKGRS